MSILKLLEYPPKRCTRLLGIFFLQPVSEYVAPFKYRPSYSHRQRRLNCLQCYFLLLAPRSVPSSDTSRSQVATYNLRGHATHGATEERCTTHSGLVTSEEPAHNIPIEACSNIPHLLQTLYSYILIKKNYMLDSLAITFFSP